MENKVIEFGSNNRFYFGLDGLEGGDDFLLVVDTISKFIKPEFINNLGGITDMRCYFIKDGIKFEAELDGMTGISLVYEGGLSEISKNYLRVIAEKVLGYIADEKKHNLQK